MKSLIKYFSLFILLSIICINNSESQILSKIGFKFGFSLNGISTFNEIPPVNGKGKPNTFITDSTSYFADFSGDFGLYAEFFNTANFCVSTELHYISRGEGESEYIVPNLKNDNPPEYEKGLLADKSNYLSLQLLPRVRAGVSGIDDNVYFFAGPTFDFLVSQKSSYTNNNYIEKPAICEIGAAMGGGFEVADILTIEVRYFIDITGPYNFKYKNDIVKRRYSSFMVLAAYTFFSKTK
jgi:hypothetical protein